jgi:hypothetical protein
MAAESDGQTDFREIDQQHGVTQTVNQESVPHRSKSTPQRAPAMVLRTPVE